MKILTHVDVMNKTLFSSHCEKNSCIPYSCIKPLCRKWLLVYSPSWCPRFSWSLKLILMKKLRNLPHKRLFPGAQINPSEWKAVLIYLTITYNVFQHNRWSSRRFTVKHLKNRLSNLERFHYNNYSYLWLWVAHCIPFGHLGLYFTPIPVFLVCIQRDYLFHENLLI